MTTTSNRKAKITQFTLRSIFLLMAVLGAILVYTDWQYDWRHESSESMPQLSGLTQAQLLQKLGPPLSSRDFPIEEAQTAFTDWLRFRQPPLPPKTMIRQLDWERHAYKMTIWLAKTDNDWIVIDGQRYHYDVQF